MSLIVGFYMYSVPSTVPVPGGHLAVYKDDWVV